jgi:tetratricopeptide (TPR) repeat protein
MYNDLEVGSYLAWDGWPRYRVFQDPRINGYPASMHAVLRRADLTAGEWQGFLDGFGVTSALVSYPSLNPRAALFDPARWALVYHAGDGLLFARRDAPHAALIRGHEVPLTFARDASVDGAISERVLEQRPAASPVSDCEWRARVADTFVERGDDARARPVYEQVLRAGCAEGERRRALAVALGDLDLRAGDPAAAVAAYSGVEEADVRAKRGLALLALRRVPEALADFAAARRARPDDADAALGVGLAHVALGHREAARAALEDFLRLAPDHVAAGRARAELAKLR